STVELSIYIDPVCVGKGLGKTLLDRLVELANDRFHALVALICSENEASIKLFASRDFVVAGELKEVGYKFDRYLDVTFMERLVKPRQST
ncbi:MAG: N-acetyltransferase, partial [Candidatus Obscuribacter sp.]|nr:N-acetyltransferase [Candidatus Obscuribacter sp.]